MRLVILLGLPYAANQRYPHSRNARLTGKLQCTFAASKLRPMLSKVFAYYVRHAVFTVAHGDYSADSLIK